MNTSIQFLSAVMMAIALGSLFWVYEATSSSVFRPRKRDRRTSIRPQTNDRRSNQVENVYWVSAEFWIHRIVWLFVIAMVVIDFAMTVGPKLGYV